MKYLVRRGEQQYGPYSLTELQQYVQSGNVATEDLAQSEGMDGWIPVIQILGDIPAPTQVPEISGDVVEHRLVPLPPNLHWVIVLVLGVITRQLFNLLWAMIQANWARRLSGDNKPLVLVAMYPAGMIAGILTRVVYPGSPWIGGLLIIGGSIVYLFGMFAIKAAMEEYYNSTENIGLQLSGAMTFFFSTVYIQYHINSLARLRKTGVLS